MKKKIGDLTLKEAKTICNSKNKKAIYPYCQKICPLYYVCGCFDEFTKDSLDQEIGVEELPDQYPEYQVGEAVLYQNGDKFELGIIKTVIVDSMYYPIDEYFVWYHSGDTAARTHARNLHKISNEYAFHIIRLDPEDKERR